MFTLNTNQSRDVRDAFAKGIYGRLFVHIVKKINVAIHRQDNNKLSEDKCAIGVLDIFGFENFDANSFEQVGSTIILDGLRAVDRKF